MKFLFPIFLFINIFATCQNKAENIEKHTYTSKSITNMDSNEYWKAKLTPQAYEILRNKGTERPHTGEYNMHFKEGIYICGGCGTALFESESKFDGHCGWPSFDSELGGDRILKIPDNSHGMSRTEIVCKKCGGHLGHIFDDGPTQTGLRYCVNSLSIDFLPKEKSTKDEIVLAGGCFWCIESAFNYLEGVLYAESGYAGGNSPTTTYEEVCTGKTGHAEVVKVVFDPVKISREEILDFFFQLHDPTQLNRQGNDIGTQYRSAIFYRDESEKAYFQKYILALKAADPFYQNIKTTLEPLKNYSAAEEYHQRYFEKNPENAYCNAVVAPKLKKFKEKNASFLKKK